ncbi:hypothetical protein WH52_05720 [Tenacibaculum holothuriorum]|uniref:DUF4440 domain-containing protein n=2 Tax=Tenacibaculum holothuriorum TaxID=1635173 RepID=A0A1Y2PDN7_9FLAO|nr:hypothetical protein WH52_05720 [Tenacibaculum holothuriorum]
MWALLKSFFMSAQVNEIPKYKPIDFELHQQISKMDSIFFNAYNTCDLKTQADILHEDLEFYHDKGGLSTSKESIVKALKDNICNKVTRTLIKGSIEVYPIPNYGAVQVGYHKFFNKLEPNSKSKPGKFIMLWKKENSGWKISRVISLH